MKLASFHSGARAGFGAVIGDRNDRIADLSGRWPSLRAAIPDLLAGKLAKAVADAPVVALSSVKLATPLPDADKILCAGLNYRLHLNEGGFEVPEFPSFFLRAHNTLAAHEEPLVMPAWSSDFDYEAELAVVIGRGGRHIDAADAMSHVVGYTLLMDGSIRDVQMKHSLCAGKNFYKSGALGPWMVTADEIADPTKLEMTGRLNGEQRQRAFLSELLFDIPTLVAYMSSITALVPGDIISTGTPAGVGFGFKPPKYMKVGDVFEIEVPGIGVLRNKVVADGRDA
ncbi:MAG: fumarylacetoacetate hydrolase family protein [Rhizomicrobium sp.]